jgi:hypothetical protein
MIYSLNEIETMAGRAARGIGFAWGLAEEAGKAARWLTEHDLPGAEVLAELLSRNDGTDYSELAPVSQDCPWHARGGRLCPIAAGAALSDRANEIATGRVVELGPTSQPLLLAAGAASAARLTGASMELAWPDALLILTADGACIEGTRAALTCEFADRVHCRPTTRTAIITPAGNRGRAVNSASWRRLDAFAQRTFAPATAASRLHGAGAGIKDSD